jgi:hypothetical protein
MSYSTNFSYPVYVYSPDIKILSILSYKHNKAFTETADANRKNNY